MGHVVVWGLNNYGHLNIPFDLRGQDVIEISSSWGAHSLALLPNGKVIGWGWNPYGQCNPPAGLIAQSVAAGSGHSLALTSEGDVIAWGANNYGQCNVPDGLKAKAIAAGERHTMAVSINGAVINMGSGTTPPPPGLEAIAVAAGIYNQAYALTPEGVVISLGAYDPPDGLVASAITANGYGGVAIGYITRPSRRRRAAWMNMERPAVL